MDIRYGKVGFMELKNARLARAENLSAEDRRKYRLPTRGLILIQTTNPDLEYTAIFINTDKDDDSNGIRGYLLSLGEFNDIEIDERD